MIIKAMEVAEAVQQSVFDDKVIAQAEMLMAIHTMGEDESTFKKALFIYSAMLASVVGDKVTKILLDENDFDKMLEEINEFDTLAENILGENREQIFNNTYTNFFIGFNLFNYKKCQQRNLNLKIARSAVEFLSQI